MFYNVCGIKCKKVEVVVKQTERNFVYLVYVKGYKKLPLPEGKIMRITN